MVTGPSRQPAPSRVTIFGLNYWPEESGIAPYTTALAEHLVHEGMAVTVVAGMPYYPHWSVRDGYRRKLSVHESIRGVSVVRYRQVVSARQSALHRTAFEATLFANSLRSLRLPRPDAVLGIVPSVASGVLARLASRRYGVPYGLLVQDLVGPAGRQTGIAGGAAVARAAGAIEGWAARDAVRVGIVADAFRPYLEQSGVPAGHIEHVPNWSHVPPPRQPRESTRARFGWAARDVVALHAGNMGLKQGLEQVVVAARVALHQQPRLRFVLMGDGNQRPALEHLAEGLPNIAFLDPQPAGAFSDVLHAADILLLTQRATVTDMSLPSKLTSYFMARRPVVAAVDPVSATARFVEHSGGGLVVPPDHPVALLDAIARLTDDTAVAGSLSDTGYAFARDHLSAAPALARLTRFVETLLEGSPIPAHRPEVPVVHDV